MTAQLRVMLDPTARLPDVKKRFRIKIKNRFCYYCNRKVRKLYWCDGDWLCKKCLVGCQWAAQEHW